MNTGIRTCRLRAIERANQINQDRSQRIVMVASLMKGGAIISVATNDYRRLSYSFKKENHYRENAGQHAEIALINGCTKKQLKGSTIIVYGISVGQDIEQKSPIDNTRPCKACFNAIKAVGIKKINFLENGEFVIRKVLDMEVEYEIQS